MYGSAASGFAANARCTAVSSAMYVRISSTFWLRPGAVTPTYSRAAARVARTVSAKNDVWRLGPGGGKTWTSVRPKSARIWGSARRTVAVDATIFRRTTASPILRVVR